jgi:uncharacterized Fe-S cluster protein YjdI
VFREYRNDQIIVYWDSEKCEHAAECFLGLPKVFVPRNRPWVNLEAAAPEEIIATIDRCPSGALTYALSEGSTVDQALSCGPGSFSSRAAGSAK